MIYLIGGPPRMGKSTLAQKLLNNYGLPYVSTDGLTVMLKPAGQPSFYSPQKAELFYPYLDLFISRIKHVGPDYVIEGDAFSPHHVVELSKKYEVRSVFLTMSGITAQTIVDYVQHDDWVLSITAEQMNGLVTRIRQASTEIAAACKTHDLAYFDLTDDYYVTFERAYNHLIIGR